MSNLLLVLFTLFTSFLFIFLVFFLVNFKKHFNQPTKTISSSQLMPTGNEQEYNPDINTNNWDLHKFRLNKFGRSQYKGLTFFISSEDRIYYLSKKGSKVYC